jgi:hypothetical protein
MSIPSISELKKLYSKYYNTTVETYVENDYTFEDFKFQFFPKVLTRKNLDIENLTSCVNPNIIIAFFRLYIRIRYPYLFHLSVNFESKHYLTTLIENEQLSINQNLIFHIILNVEIAHSIVLFYDYKTCNLCIYDPNGQKYNYNMEMLKRSLRTFFEKSNIKVKQIISHYENCPEFGILLYEYSNRKNENNLIHRKGYCLYWSYLMIEMRINNPQKDYIELENNLIKYSTKFGITNYITEYVLYIHNLIYKVILFADKINNNLTIYDYVSNVYVIECVVYNRCLEDLIKLYSNPELFVSKYFENCKLINQSNRNWIEYNGQYLMLSRVMTYLNQTNELSSKYLIVE